MPKSPLETVLTALADPIRRRALQILHATDELCVLMNELDASQSRMSRHMAALKDTGLVLDRRDAQWARYRLNPNVPATLATVIKSIMAAGRSEMHSRSVRKASRRSRESATA